MDNRQRVGPALLVLVAVWCGYSARAEAACEPLRFEDPDLGRLIAFAVDRVHAPMGEKDTLLFTLSGEKATADKGVEWVRDGDSVKSGDRVLATVQGNEVRLGTVTYLVNVEKKGDKGSSISVSRDGLPLVKLNEAAFCFEGAESGKGLKVDEVQQMLVHYVVWRERFVPAALRPSPDKLERRWVMHLQEAGRAKFKTCKTKSAFMDPPTMAGKITVRMTVDAKGEKAKVEVLGDTTGSKKLASCLSDALSTLEAGTLFAGVSVDFPFVVKPGD